MTWNVWVNKLGPRPQCLKFVVDCDKLMTAGLLTQVECNRRYKQAIPWEMTAIVMSDDEDLGEVADEIITLGGEHDKADTAGVDVKRVELRSSGAALVARHQRGNSESIALDRE